jgi:hypothetical protein
MLKKILIAVFLSSATQSHSVALREIIMQKALDDKTVKNVVLYADLHISDDTVTQAHVQSLKNVYHELRKKDQSWCFVLEGMDASHRHFITKMAEILSELESYTIPSLNTLQMTHPAHSKELLEHLIKDFEFNKERDLFFNQLIYTLCKEMIDSPQVYFIDERMFIRYLSNFMASVIWLPFLSTSSLYSGVIAKVQSLSFTGMELLNFLDAFIAVSRKTIKKLKKRIGNSEINDPAFSSTIKVVPFFEKLIKNSAEYQKKLLVAIPSFHKVSPKFFDAVLKEGSKVAANQKLSSYREYVDILGVLRELSILSDMTDNWAVSRNVSSESTGLNHFDLYLFEKITDPAVKNVIALAGAFHIEVLMQLLVQQGYHVIYDSGYHLCNGKKETSIEAFLGPDMAGQVLPLSSDVIEYPLQKMSAQGSPMLEKNEL